jgi:hypothetical protein
MISSYKFGDIVKIFFISIALLTLVKCGTELNITCKEEFYQCAADCSNICSKTIKKDYEFGKCFSNCSKPCRKEYCEEIIKI